MPCRPRPQPATTLHARRPAQTSAHGTVHTPQTETLRDTTAPGHSATRQAHQSQTMHMRITHTPEYSCTRYDAHSLRGVATAREGAHTDTCHGSSSCVCAHASACVCLHASLHASLHTSTCWACACACGASGGRMAGGARARVPHRLPFASDEQQAEYHEGSEQQQQPRENSLLQLLGRERRCLLAGGKDGGQAKEGRDG